MSDAEKIAVDDVDDEEPSTGNQEEKKSESESEDDANKVSDARDGLSKVQMNAYKVGHFNNDLCASMWFIYLTYYLTYVVELDPQIVAGALLSG